MDLGGPVGYGKPAAAAEPVAEEEPLEAPAGEGGEIESGTPGVLYVRKTSYYYFGGQRVAMRQTSTWNENVVYYLVGDHLGTTSVVLDANGDRVAESRHLPYGGERWSSGTLPTDYRFTGQRDTGLGLYHMGARFYDSSLNRWLSADTIVPEPGNPQSLNRYSYANNSPLVYVDPSGHKSRKQWKDEFREAHDGQDPTEQDWWDYQFSLEIADWTAEDWTATIILRALMYAADVRIKSGDAQWKLSEVALVGQVLDNIAQAFGGDISRLVGGVTFKRNHASQWPLGLAWTRARAWCGFNTIHINDSTFNSAHGPGDHVLTHELGHYFQRKRGLIDDFRKATGGSQFNLLGVAQLNLTPYHWGGTPPNKWVKDNGLYEDFAASFEVFVYAQIGQPISGAVLDVSRSQFFSQYVLLP